MNYPTKRERFKRAMNFKQVDRLPNFEFGYWNETLPEWHRQGLSENIDNESKAYEYFGIEYYNLIGYNDFFIPAFESYVIEENETRKTVIDELGVKLEINKNGSTSIPHYIDYPVRDRETWNEIKTRLDYMSPGRKPAEWKKQAEQLQKDDIPTGIYCGSILGFIRDMMGFENFAMAFYDMPDLMHDMIDYMTEYSINIMELYINDFRFDFAEGGEDIAYRNGPIISPAMFREFAFPGYKRIGDYLHKHGIDIIFTDCDGDVTPITDQWIEAGYSCLFPVEVHAGTDPVKLRQKYGKDIRFIGGVNKMQLRYGKDEILREMKRLEPVINQGGFIPHIDHRCPPDIPLENYIYYLDLKKKMLGIT